MNTDRERETFSVFLLFLFVKTGAAFPPLWRWEPYVSAAPVSAGLSAVSQRKRQEMSSCLGGTSLGSRLVGGQLVGFLDQSRLVQQFHLGVLIKRQCNLLDQRDRAVSVDPPVLSRFAGGCFVEECFDGCV